MGVEMGSMMVVEGRVVRYINEGHYISKQTRKNSAILTVGVCQWGVLDRNAGT
jgi:hypothetical protein